MRGYINAAMLAALAVFAAAPAAAQTLQGQFAGSGEVGCLNSPSGFNSQLQPNDPNHVWTTSASFLSLHNFNGSGGGSQSGTQVGVLTPVKVSSNASPRANSEQTSGSFTDTVGAGNAVTITASNVSGTVLTGPGSGATFTVDQIVTAGFLSPDGSTLTLASSTTNIETVTVSTGESFQRICHRSGTFVLNPSASSS